MSTKKILQSVCGALLLLSLIPSIRPAQTPIRVAVLDFDFPENTGELRQLLPNVGQIIMDRIESGLVSLQTYEMVERRRIIKILEEQNLGKGGRIDDQTAAKIGRILGVDAIIYGTISEFSLSGARTDGDYELDNLGVTLKAHYTLTNTTTGRILISEESIGQAGSRSPNARRNIQSQGMNPMDLTAVLCKKLGGKWCNKVPLTSRTQLPQRPPRHDLRSFVEHCRSLANSAVAEATSKIIARVQETKIRGTDNRRGSINKTDGRVLRVSGSMLYISGIDTGGVQPGDKFQVRRLTSDRDAAGNVVSFTEKVGEVEIVEVQSSVAVGRFSSTTNDLKPQKGDQVTKY
jgi:hypothetical protein